MASAVLSSQNEPYWGERKVYMRKFNNPATTGTNNNNKRPIHPLNFNPNPSPNPNPTSKASIRPAKPSQIHDPVVHFRQRDMCPTPRETTMQSGETVLLRELSSHGRYVRYDLGTFTRWELIELKRRLITELEKVRLLKFRLDAFNQDARPVNLYQPPQISSIRPTPPPPLHIPVSPTIITDAPALAATKMPHQTKRKTPVSQGTKRSNPFSKETDSNSKRAGVDPLAERVVSSMMKRCGQILGKLMKLKFAWVFKKPVDVPGLGLFDYHQIIKKPMDLGTVKVNLESNVYKSPIDFAADVRLTFDNAMVYNPAQHDVHVMAQKMLAKFDEMFNPAYKKFEEDQFRVCGKTPSPVAQPVVAEPVKIAERVKAAEQGVAEMAVVKERVVMRKPKAREVNKREMSFEEKTRLGKELEELPQEKMLQLLSILKKKNGYLTTQDGDEIELDMEVMDKETLWELDRFVNNYKKIISKMKRQGEGGGLNSHNPPTTLPVADPQTYNNVTLAVTESEMMVDMGQEGGGGGGGGGGGEEDVDIGEEMPVGNYPPVEIERDVNVTASPSGRSGSSSSSSSGTDSSSSSGGPESSSGSDSDDCGQSPCGDEGNQADPLPKTQKQLNMKAFTCL